MEVENNAEYLINWSERQIMQGMWGAVNRGITCKKRGEPKRDQIRRLHRLQENRHQREWYSNIAEQMYCLQFGKTPDIESLYGNDTINCKPHAYWRQKSKKKLMMTIMRRC